jgi:hypothetical protein
MNDLKISTCIFRYCIDKIFSLTFLLADFLMLQKPSTQFCIPSRGVQNSISAGNILEPLWLDESFEMKKVGS